MDFNIFFIILILSICCNYTLFKINNLKISNATIRQVQDIHLGNPSRLGGFIIIFLYFCFEFIYIKNNSIFFLCFLLIFITSALEDLKISVRPLIRLLIIILASYLLISSMDVLPKFNFGFLNIFFNNSYFQLCFFSISIAAVVNGQNIVDGTNGLSGFSSLAIFTSLLFIGFYIEDNFLIQNCIIIIPLIIGFLFFNYPYGRIFMGDSGSYFLGFLSGYLVIGTFGKNPYLPTWSAVTLLFYPILEVTFSYFRKILQKKSPFVADNLHLHLKVYFLISKGQKNRSLFNALVAPLLGAVWICPAALVPLSLQKPHWSMGILFILIFIYLFIYFSVPNPKN